MQRFVLTARASMNSRRVLVFHQQVLLVSMNTIAREYHLGTIAPSASIGFHSTRYCFVHPRHKIEACAIGSCPVSKRAPETAANRNSISTTRGANASWHQSEHENTVSLRSVRPLDHFCSHHVSDGAYPPRTPPDCPSAQNTPDMPLNYSEVAAPSRCLSS